MARATQLNLRSLTGFPEGPEAQPEIQAQCVRLVQRPHSEGRFAIGLLPADERVGVPALALQLGWALSRLSRRPVGIVDANVRYPAFPVDQRRRRPKVGTGPFKPPREQIGSRTPDGRLGTAGRRGADGSVFVEREIDEWLTLLSPRGIGEAGAGVPQLELIVSEYRDSFAHLVVDLTGFQSLGDHLNAMALLDGVIIVARARSSRETSLLRLKQDVAQELNLGVILLG